MARLWFQVAMGEIRQLWRLVRKGGAPVVERLRSVMGPPKVDGDSLQLRRVMGLCFNSGFSSL